MNKRQMTRRINTLRAAADILLALEDEENRPGAYDQARNTLRAKADLLELAASDRKPPKRNSAFEEERDDIESRYERSAWRRLVRGNDA